MCVCVTLSKVVAIVVRSEMTLTNNYEGITIVLCLEFGIDVCNIYMKSGCMRVSLLFCSMPALVRINNKASQRKCSNEWSDECRDKRLSLRGHGKALAVYTRLVVQTQPKNQGASRSNNR